MRWLVIALCFLPGSFCLSAQEAAASAELPATLPVALPDAPSFSMLAESSAPDGVISASPRAAISPVIASPLPYCPSAAKTDKGVASPSDANNSGGPCIEKSEIYDRFANTTNTTPMTVGQKGKLAAIDVLHPVNVMTIAATAAFIVGTNSHTAYGPGFRGWGRDMGYTFAQDAVGEAIGTFAISSIAHEDPRYHRNPNAPTMKRVLHAISHTFVAQHDDGRPMPNYRVLAGYPLCAETSNLYVPGLATDAKSTLVRIGIGIAANPADDLITEFLPDLAARVHLRVVFVSRVLNHVAAGQPGQ